MLIALCSDKGSPGTTTSAMILASAWAGHSTALEADLAGGDLALRLHPSGAPLPETPTVLTVLTAARGRRDDDLLGDHSHRLNSTTAVVPGALSAEQMNNAGDWFPLAEALAARREATFLDLGRISTASSMLAVGARADLVMVVARPDVASVLRLRDRVTRLAVQLAHVSGAPPRLMPLLVTTARNGLGDVADLRRVLVETSVMPFVGDIGFLAFDPGAVRRLEAGEEPAGRLARTNLLRTARTVVSQITDAVPESPAASGALVGEQS